MSGYLPLIFRPGAAGKQGAQELENLLMADERFATLVGFAQVEGIKLTYLPLLFGYSIQGSYMFDMNLKTGEYIGFPYIEIHVPIYWLDRMGSVPMYILAHELGHHTSIRDRAYLRQRVLAARPEDAVNFRADGLMDAEQAAWEEGHKLLTKLGIPFSRKQFAICVKWCLTGHANMGKDYAHSKRRVSFDILLDQLAACELPAYRSNRPESPVLSQQLSDAQALYLELYTTIPRRDQSR